MYFWTGDLSPEHIKPFIFEGNSPEIDVPFYSCNNAIEIRKKELKDQELSL